MTREDRREPYVIQKAPDEGNSATPTCCLCLQETLRETQWEVARHVAGSKFSYVLCPDCATTYADEPWRAWHEADEWITMLKQSDVTPR